MPGPTSENMGHAARRIVLMDRARVALGGAAKLGEVIGVGRRGVNHKLSADRGLSDAELNAAADAIERRARDLDSLADLLRQVTA